MSLEELWNNPDIDQSQGVNQQIYVGIRLKNLLFWKLEIKLLFDLCFRRERNSKTLVNDLKLIRMRVSNLFLKQVVVMLLPCE